MSEKTIMMNLTGDDGPYYIIMNDDAAQSNLLQADTSASATCSSAATGATEVDKFKWTHQSTDLLLDLRLSMEKEFNRPVCRKKKLWTQIARKMLEIGQYNVSAEACDIKYRNLLATYKNNKKKSQQSGEGAISWEYFDKFNSVLASKASITPPPENLGCMEEIAEMSDSVITISDGEIESPPAKKKRKNELTLKEYLYIKLQRDEKEREEKKQLQLRKLELKEKEIEAINTLAAAIAGRK